MDKSPKILVVSKNKDNLSEFKALFKKSGISPKFTKSFVEAVTLRRKNTVNVVILDLDSLYSEPKKIERFIKRIKKDYNELIILLATSPTFLNLAVSLLAKGATSYIKRPIEEREIETIINTYYKLHKLLVKEKESKERVESLTKRLQSYYLVDFLTGCYNYRYLIRRLREEFKRAQRYLRGMALVLLDIVSLRNINEAYGEDIGDLVVVQVANLLRRRVRANDVICRASGGAFYAILPDTSKKAAARFCNRVYDDIIHHRFGAKPQHINIKINIGVALYPSRGIKSINAFVKACEKAIKVSRAKGAPAITFYSKDALLKETAEDVGALKDKLEKLNQAVSQGLIEMIYGFAKTIEAKDSYTGKHVEDTAYIAEEIAKKFELSYSDIDNIRHAAILHDLGKIGVEEKILLKKGKLTAKEMEKVRKHPLIAADILKSIHALSGAIPAILYHHERYDGKGYPYGLKGDEIPLAARIIAVADVYQALTSDRPYRKAYSKGEAVRIIRKEAGTHFDPKVVRAFLHVVK